MECSFNISPGTAQAMTNTQPPLLRLPRLYSWWENLEVDYSNILYLVDQYVATIRLKNTGSLITLTLDLALELRIALDRAAADESVRVIVLVCEGRGYGADTNLVADRVGPSFDAQGQPNFDHEFEKYFNQLVLKMRTLGKSIIMAINGHAAGEGACLAMMADVTIATRSSQFLNMSIDVSMVPDFGEASALLESLGSRRSNELVLRCEKLSAEQAKLCGLIWDAVADDQFVATVQVVANRLALVPALGLDHIKQAINCGGLRGLMARLDLEHQLQRECGLSQPPSY